jgi:hypothetical protein
VNGPHGAKDKDGGSRKVRNHGFEKDSLDRSAAIALSSKTERQPNR